MRRIQNHKIDDCRCPLSGRLSDQLAFVRSTIIAPNGPFLLGNDAVRRVFMKHHSDLLDAAFWQNHQSRIQAGHVFDVFPYEQDKRFPPPG